MAKKLSSREKKTKEQTKLFDRITKTMRLKVAIKTYGLDKVIWAMNRFVHKQQEIKRLTKKEQKLFQELKEIHKKIG